MLAGWIVKPCLTAPAAKPAVTAGLRSAARRGQAERRRWSNPVSTALWAVTS